MDRIGDRPGQGLIGRAAVTHNPATEGKSPTQAENDTARAATRRLQRF
jgi:hypothetical protein